ncbi:hypothetical protein QT972_18450 [Microcoleus sp. herbarium7]|uniref:hypothetical protein n=1 Tax=Microcoleus sp. herbarium7 TaxID=3055435 RepID=UPI002FD0DBE6
MNLLTDPYLNQAEKWRQTGRHIRAQFDQNTVVVDRAYRPAIARNYLYQFRLYWN